MLEKIWHKTKKAEQKLIISCHRIVWRKRLLRTASSTRWVVIDTSSEHDLLRWSYRVSWTLFVSQPTDLANGVASLDIYEPNTIPIN